MTPFSIPYFADEANLPASLPTAEEIASSTDLLSETGGRRVVGVGDHYVVKYGMRVDLLEGETMLLLERSTTVPVPRVYAMYQSADKKVNYIVMERIIGSTLKSEWTRLDQSAKEAVSFQLRAIISEMRKLESPGGYCSVGRRELSDDLFWTNDPTKPFAGPFDTESDLNNAVIAKYLESGYSRYKADHYARTFEQLFQNHGPVFSHADFQKKNIMIRKRSTAETMEEDGMCWNAANVEGVLIDWEFAGWYPSYWEYSRAILGCGLWEDDWSYWVDQILEPFRVEYAWTEQLFRELWS
ncbi:uncharacterized protein EI97DRAFT_433440 [Westerdykella ornata]|uniref:Uncharacterized protein n=1 Tax=Westerdykella ornata TaxID=318751 RepID=A0A6A6JM80_WESOR|nr:uncharacterized protein EI97DRAFT_433440 [Westerdykella ornata]KAF2276029.1 hypothetical protein EI97DRAFT_433440 [Westerdykella ornata]